MAKVFISYAYLNKDLANDVVQKLESNGVACWYAPRNIAPGQEWVTAINDAIEEASIFLLLYTEQSNESRQVANEVALAFNAGKILLPLRMSEVPMSNEIKYYMTRVHWLDGTALPREQTLELLRDRVQELLCDKAQAGGEGQPGAQGEGTQGEGVQGEGTQGVMTRPDDAKRAEGRTQTKPKAKGIPMIVWILLALIPVAILLAIFSFTFRLYRNYDSKAQYQRAWTLWEDGQTVMAREAFEKAARNGHANARLALGTLQAEELIRDAKESTAQEELLERKAALCALGEELAANGCAEGNYLLGVCAAEGFDGTREKEKAIAYFEKAAAGTESAWKLRSYGYLCELHSVTQGDLPASEERVMFYAEAADKLLTSLSWDTYEHCRRSGAEAGMAFADACTRIGDACRELGMDAQAFPWYERAADAGVPSAMNQLGLAYLRGEGVSEDAMQAREWFEKAAAAGDENAVKNLEYLQK